MSQHYVLITSINLNLFNIDLYKSDDYTGNVIDNETINSYLQELNNQESAIELAQSVSVFPGVSKINIFDKSGNLLLEVSSYL